MRDEQSRFTTFERLIAKVPSWPGCEWTRDWWRLGCVIASDGEETWEVKHLQSEIEFSRLTSLGCSGWDDVGLWWVGWDFDVRQGDRHAKNAYDSLDAAIADARKLRDALSGRAEIRLSKSGNGVHVKCPLGDPKENDLKQPDGPRIAKYIAWKLELKVDPAPLGRQAFWLCVSKHGKPQRSFELVDDVRPLANDEFGFPDLVGEALSLEMPAQPQANAAPRAPIQNATPEHERARMYIDSVAGANEGGRNLLLNGVAWRLLERFLLNENEWRDLVYSLNARCSPQLPERQVDGMLASIWRRANGKNIIGTKRSEPWTKDSFSVTTQPKAVAPLSPTTGVSKGIIDQIEDEISGKRYAVEWPWGCLSRQTNALLPGTITVFCASQGAAKSFAMLQCIQHWMENDEMAALLAMEDDRVFHVRRGMAQLEEMSEVTDPAWTKANPEKAREIYEKHKDKLEALGSHVYERQGHTSLTGILHWIRAGVQANYRVLVIDPITAKDPSGKPWIDDHMLLMRAKDEIEGSQTSLILVTHPPKTKSSAKGKGGAAWGDDCAGGAAYERFSHNIIYMERLPEAVTVACKHFTGLVSNCSVNRNFQIRKARNGCGQGETIGMYFDGKCLKFSEQGMILKKKD